VAPRWALALAIASVCAWSSATAQQYVEVGLLECNLSEPIDAEGSGTGTAAQNRHILCAFKLKDGIKATYTGKAWVVNLPAKEKRTLLWLVKAPSTMSTPPGFLEQSYASDPKTPAGQVPDMIGQANAGIVLQSMADKKEGSASTKDKSPELGIVVLEVELKLKSTTG
jgi:hypothetical protein